MLILKSESLLRIKVAFSLPEEFRGEQEGPQGQPLNPVVWGWPHGQKEISSGDNSADLGQYPEERSQRQSHLWSTGYIWGQDSGAAVHQASSRCLVTVWVI